MAIIPAFVQYSFATGIIPTKISSPASLFHKSRWYYLFLRKLFMKKFLLLPLYLLFLTVNLYAQQDARLIERIDEMLKLTQAKDIDKIMDYTYPKVFTIASREQITKALNESFETDEFSISLDSVKVKTIFPVLTINDARYVKISHSMIMRMKYKTVIDSAGSVTFIQLLEPKFGKGNIRFDQQDNTFHIFILAYLLAIKDEISKDWSFVNYDEEDGMVSLLFSTEVIEKLKVYK